MVFIFKHTLRGRSLCFVLEIFSDVTPLDTKSDGTIFGGVPDWYQEPRSWLSLLSQFHQIHSSEESVGTSTGRVILFGTIPTTIPDTTPSVILPTTHIDTTLIPIVSPTIPPSPDYTPASPDYSPASYTEFDPSEDPSSDNIPPLPATSPFLSSTNDSSDSDIPDTPSSPTHGTPFTKTTLSTQSSLVASGALRRRVMVLAPRQPIPHGRPYRYHLNVPVHIMTARKRVGALPTHRLNVRHLVDYSSSDHFYSNDSLRYSSSKTSSDSFANALSYYASSRSSSDHSLPAPSSVHHNVYSPQSSIPQLEYAPTTYQHQQSEFSQPDSGLIVPVFQKGDDPIDAINHMMSFLTAVVTSRGDKLLMLLEQRENTLLEQVEATQGNNGLSSVTTAKGRVIFPTKIALMVNLSRNGSDALTEVHNPDNLAYDLINQSEQIMTSSEQSNDVNQTETKITSDSNIIPYSQYLSETQQETV
ncbi:hypothetical protein Tco_0631393 [Tanacetum coccineum]